MSDESKGAEMTCDIKEVMDLFDEFKFSEQKKVFKKALRKATNLLKKEAKKAFRKTVGGKTARHVSYRYNMKLIDGIKSSVRKNGNLAKVHIMGDFRLKFFDLGTKERYTKKTFKNGKHAYRGKMQSNHFFKKSQDMHSKEADNVLKRTIREAIQKINEKHLNK